MDPETILLGTIPSTEGHEIGERITVRCADPSLQQRVPELKSIGVYFERVEAGWKFVGIDVERTAIAAPVITVENPSPVA